MIESVDDKIIKKIKKARGGSVFLIDDFLRFGTAKAVGKALERLVEAGEISRVSRGVYARLKQHPMFGELLPAAEDIAKAIAKKDYNENYTDQTEWFNFPVENEKKR